MSGKPDTRWGFHRLTTDWAGRIVTDIGVRQGERLVEVGAGTGDLTAVLVAAGAKVLAVELHSGRAAALRRRFADAPVTVVELDVRDFRWPGQPFRVVANPPFGITTDLLGSLLRRGTALRRADLVLRRSLVNGYADGSRGAGLLGRNGFQATRGLPVPRSAFVPRPPVDCAVMTLTRARRRSKS